MRARSFGCQSAGEFIPDPEKKDQGDEGKERPKEDDLAQGDLVAYGFDADKHARTKHAGQDTQTDPQRRAIYSAQL